MSALPDPKSDARRYLSIGGSRIGAWSVVPLHTRQAANSRPAFHGNTALDLLEQPELAGGVEVLRFLGEWTPPANSEADEGAAPVAEAVTAEVPVAKAIDADANDLRLATDGDLVALGSLACLLTSVLSASAFAALATTLF
jgi:hypothetical protein